MVGAACPSPNHVRSCFGSYPILSFCSNRPSSYPPTVLNPVMHFTTLTLLLGAILLHRHTYGRAQTCEWTQEDGHRQRLWRRAA